MKHRFASISTRLLFSYFSILLLTVVVFEGALLFSIPAYYNKSIEQYAVNKLKSAVEQFENNMEAYYPYESALREMVLEMKKDTKGRVQIINSEGTIINDSTGYINASFAIMDDVVQATKDDLGMTYYTNPVTEENLLLISKKIFFGADFNILRLIISVQEVDNVLNRTVGIIVGFGMFVLAVTVLISRYIGASITKPVKVLKDAAVQMSSGNYEYRAKKFDDDEIGELTDAINHMAEQISKSDQMRTDFIASISHELRTPLTAIKGWAETLDYMISEITQDEDILTGIEIIKKENDRLVNMVEELLDFSKLISDRMELRLEKVKLNYLVHIIIKQFTFRAKEKGLELEVKLPEEELTATLDDKRIKQCLIVLIDNAIKFTPTGGKVTTILGTVVPGTTVPRIEGEEVFIKVKDNGEGISKEDLPHITSKFYKGSSNYSGSGIGLSVCEQIVMLHNGRLDIKSELGAGTEITMYFKKDMEV